MSYRNTLQADALKLVAKKLQSSLGVEGELPEDGLAAYGDDGDDLMMALAHKIVSGEEEDADAESVEGVFARARDAESAAEELLVDEGWELVEPEAVAVNGNGNAITTPSGRRSSWSWATAKRRFRPTGTETATTTRPRSRSSRCSPSRSVPEASPAPRP